MIRNAVAFSKRTLRFRGKERPPNAASRGDVASPCKNDELIGPLPAPNRRSSQPTVDPAALNLCDLPDDVVLLVLGGVDVVDLINCKRVCLFFKDLIELDACLQYKIELAVSGMIDGLPSAGLTVPERLWKLREYNTRFCATAEYSSSSRDRDLDPFESANRRIVVYYQDQEVSWTRVRFADSGNSVSYVLQDRDAEIMPGSVTRSVIYAPPSGNEGLGERCWNIVLLRPRSILAVDVSQDLVVAYEADEASWNANVYLLSLEHSTLRPDVMCPVLHITANIGNAVLPPFNFNGIIKAQVYGQYLAMVVPYHEDGKIDSLEVWDWRCGSLIWHGHLSRLSTYTFVDKTFLAVASSHRPQILVYRFVDSQPDPGCAFSPAVVALELPPDTVRCDVMETSCPSPPTPSVSAAFWPDPALRVVAMRLHLSSRTSGRFFSKRSLDADCILLIPSATVREQAERASASHTSILPTPSGSESALSIPWGDWGLCGSVLLKNVLPVYRTLWSFSDTCFFPFGSRIALPARDGDCMRLVIVDLNPLAAVHSPHLHCERSPQRNILEGFSPVDAKRRRRPAPLLRTTYPIGVSRGPVVSGSEWLWAAAMNQNGFTVGVYREEIFDLLHIAGSGMSHQ